MSADSLYDNLRSYLRISHRLISKQGNDINVGEKFTLRITGSNAAYGLASIGKPDIVFRNPRLYVEGTKYATPVGGNGWHVLPDDLLFPGESASIDLEFTADDDLSFFADIFGVERVARVFIRADLDQNRYFRMWGYRDLRQEIDN